MNRFPDFSSDNRPDLYLLREELLSRGEILIDLTESNPTKLGFLYPREIFIHAFGSEFSWEYNPVPRGLYTARQAIAEYYQAEVRNINCEDIFLTSGTSEAYSYLFKACTHPGDEVLCQIPGYPLIPHLAELECLQVKEWNSEILREILQKEQEGYPQEYTREKYWNGKLSSRTKMLFLVSPNNPSGKIPDFILLQEIARLARENELVVVIDEVFSDYVLDLSGVKGIKRARIPEIFYGVDVFLLNGISKMVGLPGWKLGWIYHISHSGKKQVLQERLEWIADSYLSVNSLAQELLPVILKTRFLIQNQIQKRIRRNMATLEEIFSDSRIQNSGWKSDYGGAGWYASIFSVTGSSAGFENENKENPDRDLQLACKILESTKVYLHPGSFYSYPETELRFIFSLILEEERFREGIERCIDFLLTSVSPWVQES